MCERQTHHNGQFDSLKDTKETNRLQNYTTEFVLTHTPVTRMCAFLQAFRLKLL